MSFLMLIIPFLYSDKIWARSLKATADKLGQETNHIGLAVALFGLGLAGIYFMLGKQDAATKMTQALMGVLILVLSPSIITFIKGLA